MAGNDLDLGTCLQQVRERDEDAARALVQHLHPLVIRIVRNHLPVRMMEEDLAQEVFLKLFARLDQYRVRPGVPFQHWVARLTVRTCLDALRAEKCRPELRWSDLSEPESAWLDYMLTEAADVPDSAPAAAREVLGMLLGFLSPPDRLVINLLDLEEKSAQEISELTGWSKALVKVRAFRARARLRKLATKMKKSEGYEAV